MGSEHQARIKCETKEGSINLTRWKTKNKPASNKKNVFLVDET